MSDNNTVPADPVARLDKSEQRIVGLFREAFVLDPDRLGAAVLRYQQSGGRLTQAFRDEGLITGDDEPVALSIEAGSEAIDLDAFVIAPHTAYLLDPETAERCRALPVSQDGGVVLVAVCDPFDIEGIAEVKRHIKLPVRTVVASEEALERALNAFCGKSEHPTLRAGHIERAPGRSAEADASPADSQLVLKMWERLTVLEGQVSILKREVQVLRNQLEQRKG